MPTITALTCSDNNRRATGEKWAPYDRQAVYRGNWQDEPARNYVTVYLFIRTCSRCIHNMLLMQMYLKILNSYVQVLEVHAYMVELDNYTARPRLLSSSFEKSTELKLR